jgi:hypothetical protein
MKQVRVPVRASMSRSPHWTKVQFYREVFVTILRVLSRIREAPRR